MKKLKKPLAGFLAAIKLFTMLSTSVYAYYGDYLTSATGANSWWTQMYGDECYRRIEFTPSVTGYYSFYSDNKQYGDPYAYLVSAGNLNTVINAINGTGSKNGSAESYSLVANDDGNGELNFKFNYLCYAGQTYHLFATRYSTTSSYYITRISSPNYNTVTLNRDGGSGGSGNYYNYSNQAAWSYSNSSSSTSYKSPPTKPNFTFTGYYTGANGTGTRCIESNGYLNGNAYNRGGTLYAGWQQNIYTLTFNNQGAPNTTSTITAGASIPATVTVPARVGYKLNGYYSAASGGTQYYDSITLRTSK